MTDYQVLELDEDFSYEELKKAFRKKAKQYHPDKNKDCLNSHLAMTRLNQAYSNLVKKVKAGQAHNEQLQSKDKAYSIYRKGIDKFCNIHPSKWKIYSIDGLFNTGAITTHSDTPSIIQSLIIQMAEAYRNFSIVINEYEGSPWYSDALRKMKEIEKMILRYSKIKESYELDIKKTQN